MTFTDIRFRIGNLSLLSWVLVISIVAFIASSILWWQVVYKSPENVFRGMLRNNFAVTGFTREVKSDDQGVKTTELAQIQTGGDNVVRTKTRLVQGEDKVTTDAISTTSQEFVRYLNIETNRKNADGRAMDFSRAIGVWGRNETGSAGQAFSQLLLGIVPMGNASPETRKELRKFMDKHTVFSANYNSVKKEKIQGREVYVYEIQLLQQTYVEMLKAYAKSVGLGQQVAQLNPADYAEAQPINLKLSVDIVSRHLVALSYADSAARTETFSGYGIVKDTKLPQKSIPMAELQQRLSTQ